MLKRVSHFICGLVFFALQCCLTPQLSADDRLIEDALLASGYEHKAEYKRLMALEVDAVAATTKATRDGDRLLIRFDHGNKVFQDCPETATSCKLVVYRLLVHAASRHIFIVVKFGMETSEYFLINDITGHETIVKTLPVFSPESRHFLLLPDEEDEGGALQVWRAVDDKFVLAWSAPYVRGKYSAYSVTNWSSECCIDLCVRSEFSSDTEERAPKEISELRLKEKDGGWELTDVSASDH